MKINVRVKAQVKFEKIEKIDEKNYRAWVKAPRKEGKANEALRNALANYFGLSKSRITILQGITSKQKIVDIGL